MYYKLARNAKWRAYKKVDGRVKQVKSCCKAARDGDSLICYNEGQVYHCLTHNPQSLVAEIKPALDKVRPCIASPEALKAGLPIVDLKPHFQRVADNKAIDAAFADMPADKIIRLSPTGVYSETTKEAIAKARLDSPSAINRLLWLGAGVASLAYVVYAVVKAATAIGGM
jgi:hypothetical protein